MKLLMLETRRGCVDGRQIMEFERGREYEIPDSLARSFMCAGFAMPALPKPKTPLKDSVLRSFRASPRIAPEVVRKKRRSYMCD